MPPSQDPIDENVVHPKQKPDHGGLVETRPELEARSMSLTTC
jgi:hypothetical protein